MDIAKAKKLITAQKPELIRKYHIRSLGIFGSYVRGEQTKKSDLDVLVEFSKTPTLFEFIGMKNDLSDLMGLKVDLVMKSALKKNIRPRILREVVAV